MLSLSCIAGLFGHQYLEKELINQLRFFACKYEIRKCYLKSSMASLAQPHPNFLKLPRSVFG